MEDESRRLMQSDIDARADQLREVLHVVDEGQIEASARERAFIAGALHALELTRSDLGAIPAVEQASDGPV